MGKAPRGKKKKALRRAAISAEHDDLIQRESKEERTGGPLDAVPDSALFFVDTTKDAKIQRKVDRYRNKVLRYETLFKRNSLVAPVSWPKRLSDTPGGEAVLPPAAKALRKAEKGHLAANSGGKVLKEKRKREADPWRPQEGGKGEAEGERDETAVDLSAKRKSKKHKKASDGLLTEKVHKKAPAVEVDAPGCSYNPSFHDHQDALGVAVAEEMKKAYAKELEPVPPKLTVEADGVELDEEERFFLDVAVGEDDAEEDEKDDGEVSHGIARPVQVKKLTRADLNRRMRKKLAHEAASKAAEKKRQRVELGRLKELESEVLEAKEDSEKRRLRREIAREEKQAALPPKLGPHKFVPDPVRVLLTEEVTGSLRTIKGCETLARERFKSLQRRGLVEPRVPVRRKKAKNVRIVEQGSQGKREREMHDEIAAMRAERRQKGSTQLTLVE